MRELAMDLPFYKVNRIIKLTGKQCEFEQYRQKPGQKESDLREMKMSIAMSGRSGMVIIPWTKHKNGKGYSFVDAPATEIIGFQVWVGPGCEPIELGLARRPLTVKCRYSPYNDVRFQKVLESRGVFPERVFDHSKWKRWLTRQGKGLHFTPLEFEEEREIPTGIKHEWTFGGFCKTEYASDPRCGGLPNFLRCHISAMTLLERVGKLPGIRVKINDEGHYGPSVYSDDYVEARKAGREPTYVWHPATYSIQELSKQIGESSAAIAAMVGALKDVAGGKVEAPILDFPNFEQLEFKGHNDARLKPFLDAMGQVAAEVKEQECKK